MGHIRALVDRMNDVERWLVGKEAEKEKEKEKEKESESKSLMHASSTDHVKDFHDLRNKVVELQGGLGELGQEIVTITMAPNHLSAGPKRRPPLCQCRSHHKPLPPSRTCCIRLLPL